MNSKQQTGTQKKSTCHSEAKVINMDKMFVQLEGTHLTATETDLLHSKESLPVINETSPNCCANKNEEKTYQSNTSGDRIYCGEKGMNERENEKNAVIALIKPVQEIIHEMNENIQTIMGMFDPKKCFENNDKEETPKTEKYIPLEGDITSKENFSKMVSNQTELCESEGAENYSPKDLPSQTTSDRACIEKVNCNTEIISQDPSVSCVVLDKKKETTNLNNFQHVDDYRVILYGGIDERKISPPCEHTFQTLHIEAASSPSPSVMFRPPVCTRLWRIITGIIAGIGLCLQVNRDCIFCLGFFVAFVVSASFLTAFFYRTLNVKPQGIFPKS